MRYLDGFYLFDDEIDNADTFNEYDYHSPEIFEKWLKSFTLKKDLKLRKHLINFINSKEFRCKKLA